jgi:hypothetical protein
MKRFFTKMSLVVLGYFSYGAPIINEVVSDNDAGHQDKFGLYSDWVELYNPTGDTINLQGYYLSDNATIPTKWTFPNAKIAPYGYLVVIASSKNQVINGEIHTNFAISKSGEPILLSSPTGTLLEGVDVPEVGKNIAYSKNPQTLLWQYSTPTFGAYNSYVNPRFVPEPNTNTKAGFYPAAINVTFTCAQTTDQVVKVDFDNTLLSVVPNGVVNVTTNTVLRMACRNTDGDLSNPKTDSYFIGESSTLPVVSLSANAAQFSNMYTNYNSPIEIIGHAEYFDKGKTEVFDLDLQMELHGNATKQFPMKSIRISAKSSIGKSKIEGAVFADRPYKSFKQLVLRNSGNDYNRLLYRDLLNSRMAAGTNVDYLAGQPALVFVNGAFQGLYNVRERTNADYVASLHGVDPTNIDLLENNAFVTYPTIWNGLDDIKEGDNEHYKSTFNYIMAGNARSAIGYDSVKKLIDIDNFIDYFALEMYHTNWDWPQSNVRIWRPRTSTGKWRFMYFDTDFALNLFGEYRTSHFINEIDRVLNTNNSVHALLFTELMKNADFKCAFTQRLIFLKDNLLTPARYLSEMAKLENEISAEIPRQFAKYTDQMACCRSQEVAWATNFINNRPAYITQHIQTTLAGACGVNALPTVSISAPSNGTSYTAPATITISANAADSDGSISQVSFYDGTTLIATDVTAPYSVTLTTSTLGTRNLTAVAIDNSGASTTSAAVIITVNAATNMAPAVSISAPTNGSSYIAPATVTISANAADSDGSISQVRFFDGSTLISTDATAPYSVTLTTSTLGTHILTAVAIDNSGASTTSAAVSITVNAATNMAPAVSISTPTNGTSYTAPATVTISANAADSDGSISQVRFFDGSTLIATDATAPYSAILTTSTLGTHTLTAIATDNSGANTTSAAVSITVNAATEDIASSVSCGGNNSSITLTLNASLRANATSYNWWYSSSSAGVTTTTSAPYVSTLNTGANFATGQICVGVNRSASPWYSQYCKTITKCTNARTDENESVVDANNISIAPNPSNSYFIFEANSDIEKLVITNNLGQSMIIKENIKAGESIQIGESLTDGLYVASISFVNGTNITKRIIKTN